MTATGPLGIVLEHSGTALAAAAVGVALVLAYLAVEYVLLPAWRIRVAHRRVPRPISKLVGQERLRLRRLADRAAFLEEHGNTEARPSATRMTERAT